MDFLKKYGVFLLAGAAAGIANGTFGAGGGMLLVPILTCAADLPGEQVFPTSVAIMLPVCIVSLLFSIGSTALTFMQVLPYLIGSIIGGIAAGLFGKKIPVKWLHRGLGLLFLWGGIRYLW